MKDKEQKQAVPPKEDQQTQRQSAPRPTARDAAAQMYATEQANAKVAAASRAADNAMNGFHALAQVIGREQIQEARLTMQKYKEGKANLEQKIIENEQQPV